MSHVVDHVAMVYHDLSSANNIGNKDISANIKEYVKLKSMQHKTCTRTVEITWVHIRQNRNKCAQVNDIVTLRASSDLLENEYVTENSGILIEPIYISYSFQHH